MNDYLGGHSFDELDRAMAILATAREAFFTSKPDASAEAAFYAGWGAAMKEATRMVKVASNT